MTDVVHGKDSLPTASCDARTSHCVLAIETATDACSVALQYGEERTHLTELMPQAHARKVLPMIDRLLSDAGLVARDLDGVVFGRGPGSFTGLRIAAAVSQGLAFGAGIGIVGVSTLSALAQGVARRQGLGATPGTGILVALDARMGEIYWNGFLTLENGLLHSIGDDQVGVAAGVGLPAGLDSNEPLWLSGSGVDRYQQDLRVALTQHHSAQLLHWEENQWPDARDLLAALGLPTRAPVWQAAESAVPVYVRNRVALTEAQRAAGETL